MVLSLSLGFSFWSHPLAWLCGLQECSRLCIFPPPSTSVTHAFSSSFKTASPILGYQICFHFWSAHLQSRDD